MHSSNFSLSGKAVVAFAASLTAATAFFYTYQSSAQKLELAGTLTGRVFQDFNGDGLYDTTGGSASTPLAVDKGVAGVTVAAYDPAGTARGTATTAADGTFSLAAAGTGPYRIEFTTLPAGFSPSARSTDSVGGGIAGDSGTTIQLVPDGSTSNINLAVNRPVDYCQNNPLICSQVYGIGSANQPDAVFSVPFTAGSTRTSGGLPVTDFQNPGNTSLATTDQIGTTFGLAYNRSTKFLYAAAFMKKHAKFGPGGTGAIYRINTASGAVSEFVNLNTVFGANTAGANPHNTGDYDADNGNTTWNAVGRRALGGMAISDDMANLFVMNLANRTLYRIPTSGALSTATIASSAFPTVIATCPTAGDVRPFAVTYYEGNIYVGAVCSAQSSGVSANLRMIIFTADPATLTFGTTPVFDVPLNYTRLEVDPGASASWNAWTRQFSNLTGQNNYIYPQPMLTDIDFDRGNLVLSLRDRMGDQTGYNSLSNPNDTTERKKGITGGDTLRACGSPGTGWTLESNGRCAGAGSAPQGTNEGPGGGEYYYQDNYHPSGNPHDEVSNGAAAQIPGQNVLIASIFDPVYIPDDNIFDSGGFRWFVNSTGAQNRGYLAYTAGDFGKANGMGNVVTMCDAAPIEIGNRVWRDTNGNGVQDAGEAGIAGVTVRLYSGSTLVGQAVTSTNGEFYFVSSAAADPDTADNIGQVNGGILRSAAYQIRLDRAADYTTGGPLAALNLSAFRQTNQAGDDVSSDSDGRWAVSLPGSPDAGRYAVADITTGFAGSNDHRLDIGFQSGTTAARVPVSGRIMTVRGYGIRNVRVTLFESDGSVRTALTGAFGYYSFDDVTANQPVIVSIYAKRYAFAENSRLVEAGEKSTNVDFVADN